VTKALTLKIETLQKQAEWKERIIEKMKMEIIEKDRKISSLLTMKLPDSLNEQFSIFKQELVRQSMEEVEKLKDIIQDKDFQLELARADVQILGEKLSDKSPTQTTEQKTKTIT
jgi:hypothetical protein